MSQLGSAPVEGTAVPKDDVATPAAEDSRPRLRYFGDYELIEEIARGGMGIVWRARQISLNRIVAVKMIRTGLLADDAEVRRFRAEAEAAASLDHPNIVPIYEIGEHAGQQYFSMKLIEGHSLAASVQGGCWLKTHCPEHRPGAALLAGRLRCCATAAQLLATVARAVHHAHQRGILHRDLKPGNILLDAHGEPHVTDFGLAKQVESAGDLTLSGAVLGTPSYMAPEQAAGGTKHLSTAADIYALGAILYEMLSGQPPFKADTPLETLRQVTENEPKRPSALNSNTDPDLETICLKCLAKEPARRYGSAEALAEDLERWLRHEPIQARPTGPVKKIQLWCQRRPIIAGLTAAIILVLLAGFAGVFVEWRQAERQTKLANTAARKAQEELWQSDLAQARARRLSGQQGQRIESLKALATAWKIRPDPELRDEAIACLALDDLEEELGTITFTSRFVDAAFDEELKQAAVAFPNGEVRLFQLSAPRSDTVLPSESAFLSYLKFSPDGHWLFGRATNQVLLWDVARRRIALRVPTELFDPPFLAADFYLSSRWLSFGDGGRRLRNYELTTTNQWIPQGTARHEGVVRAVAYLPSKTRVTRAVLSGEALEFFEVSSNNTPSRVLANEAGAVTLEWINTDKLAIGLSNGAVRILTVESNLTTRLEGHTLPVRHLCRLPAQAMLASASDDGTTMIWQVGAKRRTLFTDQGLVVQTSRDGQRLAFTRRDWELGVWRFLPTREFTSQRTHLQAVEDVSLSPDGAHLLSVSAGGVTLTEVRGDPPVFASYAIVEGSGYSGALFARDGQSFVLSDRGGIQPVTVGAMSDKVKLRNALQPGRRQPAPAGVVLGRVARFPDGRRLAVETDSGVLLLDGTSGEFSVLLTNQPGVAGLSVSSDGRWLATGSRSAGDPKVWDAQTGARLRALGTGSASVAFSPAGGWLVVGTPAEFGFWDMARWEKVRVVPREDPAYVPGLAAFSGDGALVALQLSARQIGLYDVGQAMFVARLTASDPWLMTSLCVSPDGLRIAAGCNQGTVRVWDLKLLRRSLHGLGMDW